MKICLLSWEFPPRIVGGIARHVYGLAKALAKHGHDVGVVTLDFPGTPSYEEVEGFKVYRSKTEVGHPNFLTWAFLFNHFLEKELATANKDSNFDLIHIHDWLVAPAGIGFKQFLNKPLVCTMHSTEFGRSSLNNPDSYMIDGMEWWACFEATRVVVTTNSMKGEICGHFHVPGDKVDVIPNAIEVEKFNVEVDYRAIRGRFGIGDHEKLVLFVGRLVPQKGIEYLIRAMPRISWRFPEVKLVIVGEGWMRSHLEWLANQSGQSWRINFAGFISDKDLLALAKSADVMVVPSVYEPFGIVALEGMAAGTPVVASQVGGLAEVVEHDKTGVYVYPRSPDSIAWGIERILSDSGYRDWLIKNAHEAVNKRFSWEIVANQTIEVYKRVLGER
ncbi:MAG: glycosyltransferase family 4 protein [Candidatus Bathyarchaeota archaeon]|nr:MAG: glycosyltransferase family 4 protein [Candidatus Bathyarchaeota archaeon]